MEIPRQNEIVNRLNNHGERIKQLEIFAARSEEKIENLIKKLEDLTTWIKALVMLFAASFVGFFFWYVQNLK